MQAQPKDFSKVMDVTKEQLQIALENNPKSLRDGNFIILGYNEVTKRRWKEDQRSTKDCGAIKALEEVLKPGIVDLIREQRLNFACAGTMFNLHSRTKKYVKLSPHQKYIWFWDWNNPKSVPENDLEMTGKIAIEDIKDFRSVKGTFSPFSTLE